MPCLTASLATVSTLASPVAYANSKSTTAPLPPANTEEYAATSAPTTFVIVSTGFWVGIAKWTLTSVKSRLLLVGTEPRVCSGRISPCISIIASWEWGERFPTIIRRDMFVSVCRVLLGWIVSNRWMSVWGIRAWMARIAPISSTRKYWETHLRKNLLNRVECCKDFFSGRGRKPSFVRKRCGIFPDIASNSKDGLEIEKFSAVRKVSRKEC